MDIQLRYNLKNQRYFIIAGALFILLFVIELIVTKDISYFNIALALTYLALIFIIEKYLF
jgi:hypothetical protein